MVAEPLPPADAQAGRILDGALRALARYGVAKLTLDDVAREAGCSRATLYRYFPGKTALLHAVLQSETARLTAGLDAALAEVTTLGEALAAVGTYGAREFAGHEALQFLLAHEPGTILPHLCSGPGGRLLDRLAGVVGPHLCRFLPPLEARRTGEWLARIVLSYGCTPPPGQSPARSEAAVEAVVREFVVPGFDGRASD
jgi:AcrR family transcriptional regulator